jgi:hypothetical protein
MMTEQAQRTHAQRFSFMFAILLIAIVLDATDARALTRNQAANATQGLAVTLCGLSVPQSKGFRCRFRSDLWVFRHTSEVLTRRTGPFRFQRAYSLLRYVWAKRGNPYGIEYGCNTIIGQYSFGFVYERISTRCENPRKPRMIGIVRLPGGYHR